MKKNKTKNRPGLLLTAVCLLAGLLSACVKAMPEYSWQKTVAFPEYAEQVFMRQNQLVSEILLLDEDMIDVAQYEKILQAEKNLQTACALLNEYAIREIDGLQNDVFFTRKVMGSVDQCEESISVTQSQLSAVNVKY